MADQDRRQLETGHHDVKRTAKRSRRCACPHRPVRGGTTAWAGGLTPPGRFMQETEPNGQKDGPSRSPGRTLGRKETGTTRLRRQHAFNFYVTRTTATSGQKSNDVHGEVGTSRAGRAVHVRRAGHLRRSPVGTPPTQTATWGPQRAKPADVREQGTADVQLVYKSCASSTEPGGCPTRSGTSDPRRH